MSSSIYCSINGDSPCDVLGNAWNNIALVVHDTLILKYFIFVSTCVHLWCLTTIHMIKSDYRWKWLHYLNIIPHACMCQLIQRDVNNHILLLRFPRVSDWFSKTTGTPTTTLRRWQFGCILSTGGSSVLGWDSWTTAVDNLLRHPDITLRISNSCWR